MSDSRCEVHDERLSLVLANGKRVFRCPQCLMDEVESLRDKALRFDLDQAGIARRETEAAELVNARATIAQLKDWQRAMIEKVANQSLAGYRELGEKLAAKDCELDELKSRLAQKNPRAIEAERLLKDIYEHGANLTNWRDIEGRLVAFVEGVSSSGPN
jgi:hypothetical protein